MRQIEREIVTRREVKSAWSQTDNYWKEGHLAAKSRWFGGGFAV
jgi:hypothetical protein